MKILLGIFLVAAIVGSYYFFVMSTVEEPAVEEVLQENSFAQGETGGVRMVTYKNQFFNFSFLYRSTPYGYLVFENTKEENIASKMLYGMSLIRVADYESVMATKDTDGPPSITVSVYQGGGDTDIATWLYNNKQATNCEEETVLATVVAKQDAASCFWDGLYAGITVGVLRDDKVYLLTGTRDETEEGKYSYKKDFDEVVGSFIVGE